MIGTVDIDHLRQWIGREDVAEDIVTPRLAASLRAIMDVPEPAAAPGDEAPLAIHWCLAPAISPMSGLGLDGHPKRGGMLPPVPLPRRMWAGGQLVLSGRFAVGDVVRRHSVVRDVVLKQGRTGALCFVTVDHDYIGPAGLVMTERQDLVYRDAPAPDAVEPPLPTPPKATWSRSFFADPVLLFRYSAVTFNGHRIHYDRDHSIQVERHQGLIVHGPLQATLMLEFAAGLRGSAPAGFDFRAVSPLVDRQTITIGAAESGESLALWTVTEDGRLGMTAQAHW